MLKIPLGQDFYFQIGDFLKKVQCIQMKFLITGQEKGDLFIQVIV
jgi:hypothetical protein